MVVLVVATRDALTPVSAEPPPLNCGDAKIPVEGMYVNDAAVVLIGAPPVEALVNVKY